MDKVLDSLDHPYRLRAVKKEAEDQIAELKKTWSNKDDKILTAMENDRINKETFFPKRFEVVGGKRYLGWKGENETNDRRLIEEEKFVAVSEIPADFSLGVDIFCDLVFQLICLSFYRLVEN